MHHPFRIGDIAIIFSFDWLQHPKIIGAHLSTGRFGVFGDGILPQRFENRMVPME